MFILLVLISPHGHLTATSQAPTLPTEDDEIYFGHHWGAAGIVDVMIEIVQSGLVDSEYHDRAMRIAEAGLNGIWENRYISLEGETVAAWAKFDGAEIFPGKKYGAAGIVDTLLKIYELTANTTYLDWATEALDELYAQSLNQSTMPHWSYSYLSTRGAEGIYITDWNFGSTGIIDTTLNLYAVSGRDLELVRAERVADWMRTISYEEEVNGVKGLIPPWYQADERINNTFTSYRWGTAGSIPVLIRLYQVTSNSSYLDWAKFIGQWLASVQRDDGAWNENPVSTVQPTLDLEHGVAGVLRGLHFLAAYNSSQEVQTAVDAGMEWLLDQFISNTTYSIFPVVKDGTAAKYSLYEGMAGINRALREMGQFTHELNDSYRTLLEDAIYTYSSGGSSLLGLFPSTAEEQYVDLSYSHGLSGVVQELIRANQEELIDLDVDLVTQYIDTVAFYQLDTGLFHRQVETGGSPAVGSPIRLITIGLLSALVAIYLIRRKFNSSDQ